MIPSPIRLLPIAGLLCLVAVAAESPAHADADPTESAAGAGHPALAEAWREFRAGRADAAGSQLATLAPEVRELAEAHLLQGLVDLAHDQPEAAARALATIAPDQPLGVVASYNRILALLALDRPDDAATVARALAAIPMTSNARREAIGAALYNAALAFSVRGHTSTARQLLAIIGNRLPDTAAAAAAAELLARAPDRAPPLAATCITDYRDKRFREARACFRDLVATSGPDPELLYAIGYASYQLDDYGPAIAAFEQALMANPRDGDVLFMLAMAHAHHGEHAIAIARFRDALAAGMVTEDPAEARRYVASLEKLLATRIAGGWAVTADAAVGYDTHPLPTGGAAAATSSFGDEVTGSGFSTLRAGLGYRWPRYERRSGRLAAITTVGYELSQYLLISDFGGSTGRGHGMPVTSSLSDLSLQTHTVRLGSQHQRGAFNAGGRATAGVELAGLSDFSPLLATASLAPEAGYRWNARTSTAVIAGWTPQWALSSDIDHLAGEGLFLDVRQSFHLHPRVAATAGYRFASWWLGRLTADPGDCPGGETCSADVPYSHHSHRPMVRLTIDLGGMVLGAEAALEQRVYWGDGLYIQRDGSTVTAHRSDLAEVAMATVTLALGPRTDLLLDLGYTHNDSTIDAATAGSEEGYDRFAAGLQLSYHP